MVITLFCRPEALATDGAGRGLCRTILSPADVTADLFVSVEARTLRMAAYAFSVATHGLWGNLCPLFQSHGPNVPGASASVGELDCRQPTPPQTHERSKMAIWRRGR